MTAQEHQAQTERPKLLLHGFDTLEVSYWLNVRASKLDFVELGAAQQRAKDARRDGFVEITLGSETFALKPYGRKPYTYVLDHEDFEVRLAEFMRPACAVRYYSKGLWLSGIGVLAKRFDDWRQSMGLVVTKPESVSRADWAFDYHLASIDFGPDHFVTRARKDAQWRDNGAFQTFKVGQDQVVLRVYDKVAEIHQQSGKEFLYELWQQGHSVWRVEFQVRGERLKEGGIRTLDDLTSLQNDLLRQLASDHTTLRRPTDDTNRSRWPLHPLWRAVQADISTLPQTGLVRHIDPKAPLNIRLYFQSKSIYGHLKGVAALLALLGEVGAEPRLDDVLTRLRKHLAEHHQPDLFADDVQSRINGMRYEQ